MHIVLTGRGGIYSRRGPRRSACCSRRLAAHTLERDLDTFVKALELENADYRSWRMQR
jgi:hypothetical protein